MVAIDGYYINVEHKKVWLFKYSNVHFLTESFLLLPKNKIWNCKQAKNDDSFNKIKGNTMKMEPFWKIYRNYPIFDCSRCRHSKYSVCTYTSQG